MQNTPSDFVELLRAMVKEQASDLILKTGGCPAVRTSCESRGKAARGRLVAAMMARE